MKLTRDLLIEYAGKLSTSKKTPPAVSFALKDVKAGKAVSLELATKTCLFLLSYDPEIEIDSLVESIGHVDNLASIQAAYSSSISASLTLDDEDESDADIAPVAPSNRSGPKPGYLDNYLTKFGFVNRQNTTDFNSSDECLAQIALHCIAKNTCLLLRDLEKWYVWTGYKWKESCVGDIRLVLDGVRECIKEDLSTLRYKWKYQKNEMVKVIQQRLRKDDLGTEALEKIYKSETSMMVKMIGRLSSVDSKNSVVKTIGDHVMKDSCDMDRNIDYLVFKNGVWDAKNNKIIPADPLMLPTKCINIDWAPPTQEATVRFQEFLVGLGFDDETIAFLKRSFGYAILGRGNAKRFWWFRGERNTGKTSLTQLVAKTLDEYSEMTATSLWLQKSGSRPGHTDDLAALRAARLVVCDEFPEVCRFDDSLLKQSTGGAIPMRASAKGEKGATFRIMFALFFSSNFDPKISSEDGAALGRLTALTFKSKVKNAYEGFVDDYVSNLDNRRAILQWAMEGAVEYIRDGFGEEPEAIKVSREEFKGEQVSIADQLRQILSVGKQGRPAKSSQIKIDLVTLQKRTKEYSPIPSTRKLHEMIKDIFGMDPPKSCNGDYTWDNLFLVSSLISDKYDKNIDWRPEPDLFNDVDSPN